MTGDRRAPRGGVRGGRVLLPISLLAALVSAGCARPGSPRGGPVPSDPLRVVATDPAEGARVAPFDGPVRIHFQRTVSERLQQGTLAEAVLVSPATGRVNARLRGESLEVSVEGGYRAGTIYRVTVLPRLRDRYQNPMASAFDLFFSTGPEFEPTLLAGVATDRITLRPVGGVRVEAVPTAGGGVLATATDSTGIFAFPFLGAGEWTLSLYEDRNRSGIPDGDERRAAHTVTVARGDTLVLTDVALLAPDDTPAELQGIAALDSLALRLTFDDYLDPAIPIATAAVTMVPDPSGPPGGGVVPEILEVLHRGDWDARNPPAGGAVGVVAGVAGRGGGAGAQVAPGTPSRELILLLAEPLPAGVPYRIAISGVANLNGVPGGGGERTFTRTAPPAPAG